MQASLRYPPPLCQAKPVPPTMPHCLGRTYRTAGKNVGPCRSAQNVRLTSSPTMMTRGRFFPDLTRNRGMIIHFCLIALFPLRTYLSFSISMHTCGCLCRCTRGPSFPPPHAPVLRRSPSRMWFGSDSSTSCTASTSHGCASKELLLHGTETRRASEELELPLFFCFPPIPAPLHTLL